MTLLSGVAVVADRAGAFDTAVSFPAIPMLSGAAGVTVVGALGMTPLAAATGAAPDAEAIAAPFKIVFGSIRFLLFGLFSWGASKSKRKSATKNNGHQKRTYNERILLKLQRVRRMSVLRITMRQGVLLLILIVRSGSVSGWGIGVPWRWWTIVLVIGIIIGLRWVRRHGGLLWPCGRWWMW